jgi:hypothetical protein
MSNVVYDKALSFGKIDPLATGTFPDTLNLGLTAGGNDTYPDKEFTSAGRMTVDVCCAAPAGGTGLTVIVEGSATGTSGWQTVGTNTFTLAELKSGACPTAVSPNAYQYLRVRVTASGTFTAGSAEAFLNTYAGK